ncbi:SOS response-associated peptidase [Funiculus sociatus GB2-A5]|uniref:Abasic site processing protein n=1 Tax=Funiculus sociatus GB2-A5 TaxID=2933946 RepID=A0ABV0JIN5_9CYAN|nr:MULTISPECIES: SOS response-associated peptidase [unclassified Trichocoleus]MBD1904641.1 SOS response-associated peptidase [Trichocoleus sp. FACHB-832]MBD2062440.1 SOS response-associated peptidase [Trichocoleus sp. FACHB-6]
MCGRFSQSKSAETIAQVFQVNNVPPLTPRYNIAPTQQIQTILQNAEQSQREFQILHWGLIPSWAKDPKMGARMINARAETVAEKPSFRAAFKQRRCLILADGFYEWQQQEKKKQPFYFRMNDENPFAFAGLWEHWKSDDGEVINSCTILTTEPNDLMRPVHNRMPVIIDPKDYDLWLDTEVKTPELLQPLLHPYSAEEMTAYPVSTKVNKPVNDSAELINSL